MQCQQIHETWEETVVSKILFLKGDFDEQNKIHSQKVEDKTEAISQEVSSQPCCVTKRHINELHSWYQIQGENKKDNLWVVFKSIFSPFDLRFKNE